MSKQKDKNIYLVGCETEKLYEHKLPTNREVLSYFFYKHNSLNLPIRDSYKSVLDDVENIWRQTGISISRSHHNVIKLKKLHEAWKSVKKCCSRKNSKKQKSREQIFINKLNNLFDIALKNEFDSLTMTQRNFLSDQRKKNRHSRVSSITSQPIETNRLIGMANDRTEEDQAEIFDENKLSQTLSNCSILDEELSEASSALTMERLTSNFEDEIFEPKPKRRNIMTPDLAAALDRTKTSSRNAAYILAAAAISLNVDVHTINLSSSTIHQSRIKFREAMAIKSKTNLTVAKCVVVHWDGKLLSDLVGPGKVERLPIVLSGLKTEKLLGVPKLKNGTGLNQASAIIEVLNEWDITDRVKAMSFDTTSVNTGHLNGTCMHLENGLNKNLLYLACRHHIYELILRCVFECCWPETTGPNVAIFKRFQQNWNNIDKNKYDNGLSDELIVKALDDKVEEILGFILCQLKELANLQTTNSQCINAISAIEKCLEKKNSINLTLEKLQK